MKFGKYFDLTAYSRRVSYFLTRCRLVFRYPVKVIIRVDSFRIIFVVSSMLEYRLRARESYNRETVTMYWLRTVVSGRDVVYDVGANVGAYSLYAGKKLAKFSGKVYAFEPAYFNFLSLCRNIAINQVNDTVVPYPLAFGGSSTATKFFLSSTIEGSALHGLGEPVSEGNTFVPKFQQGVFVTSLDEFVLNRNVDFPNHIKIDVDGSEGEILAGMESVMRDKRMKSIMIEINGDLSQGEFERSIISSGFDEVMVEKWPNGNTFNKLFVRRQ